MADAMDDAKGQMKRWVETWRAAGPELEAIRRRELREFDWAEKRSAFLGMWELVWAHRRSKTTSGLVEMQRILQKARR